LGENSQPSIIGTFGFKSGKDCNKFDEVEMAVKGFMPVVADACAYITCEVVDKMETSTHTVFLGKVLDADILKADDPMTYAYYHNVIKGKSPKNAPTYIAEEATAAPAKEKYVCSVCGYEEQSIEELDNSYDVYLSIPIEIPLNFDSETKSYTGNEQIYAYGTLGNAYEGIQLVIDKEADTYGKAIMEGNGYDISSYLSVGFVNGDTATFSSNQLAENADYVTNGAFDALYQEQMNVSVNVAAFIESGAGEYQISIPLKFELK
jgi:hypothetical protein